MPAARSRLIALAILAATTAAHADDTDPVVIRVGPRTMSASEVAHRLAALPLFQRATLGRTPDEIRKRFAATVLVPEMLKDADAEERGLASTPAVQGRVRDALRRALVESVRQDLTREGIPDAEVSAYYDAHRGDYQRPERLRVFRILVDDEALARKILSEAKGPGGPERWSALARDHSVDAATKLRSGALGFVLPDGSTDVPQLTVDPALYAAASKVRDGEICPEPMREGTHFAVIWRRGTLPKLDRPLETERGSVTAILVRQRVDRAITTLLDGLRKRDVHDESPALLDALPAESPTPPSRETRETRETTPRDVRPTPMPSERGLR